MSSGFKALIQQCLSAQLQVNPLTDEWVSIGRGCVIYMTFLKNFKREDIGKTDLKICSNPSTPAGSLNSRKVSILEAGGDILLIPQASLGGKPKGSIIQYHDNVAKEIGKELYTEFCNTFKNIMKQGKGKFEAGTYGNQQKITLTSDGPMSHIIN